MNRKLEPKIMFKLSDKLQNLIYMKCTMETVQNFSYQIHVISYIYTIVLI
jgi:hypothetical protein